MLYFRGLIVAFTLLVACTLAHKKKKPPPDIKGGFTRTCVDEFEVLPQITRRVQCTGTNSQTVECMLNSCTLKNIQAHGVSKESATNLSFSNCGPPSEPKVQTVTVQHFETNYHTGMLVVQNGTINNKNITPPYYCFLNWNAIRPPFVGPATDELALQILPLPCHPFQDSSSVLMIAMSMKKPKADSTLGKIIKGKPLKTTLKVSNYPGRPISKHYQNITASNRLSSQHQPFSYDKTSVKHNIFFRIDSRPLCSSGRSCRGNYHPVLISDCQHRIVTTLRTSKYLQVTQQRLLRHKLGTIKVREDQQ
ncbi:hypothetical protein O181_010879 [Austropuccinia psidii MF-1]|uniref:Uncharacterized protein n=1 Tax=Austropuccinia psidii MF-1 TaxID=1389203 RepID=A0A9Q3BRX1_9BASI|nr:hypothetical protein [Austropuccinia psidii MF-1]